MLTKNPAIFKAIDKLAVHFNTNVANKYLRGAIYRVELGRSDNELYQELLEKSDYYKYQGHHIDELYLKILAFCRFIKGIRREVLPNAKMYAVNSVRDQSVSEKTLAEMAGRNFESNLKLLAEILGEVFTLVLQEDQSMNNGKPAFFTKNSDLKEIKEFLAL